MAIRTSSIRRHQVRWRVAALLLGAAVVAAACSGDPYATSTPAAPGTVPGSVVNFRSTSSTSSVVTAVALWKELRAAGVPSTITGYDQSGRFSLTTTDPARLRQVVADVHARSAGTTGPTGSCASTSAVGAEESATPPAPQPGPATDRTTTAFQTSASIAAGTTGEDAFGGGSIREISIRAEDRPPTVVVAATGAAQKQAAADFGPGLIVVDGMFADPALDKLQSRTDRTGLGAC